MKTAIKSARAAFQFISCQLTFLNEIFYSADKNFAKDLVHHLFVCFFSWFPRTILLDIWMNQKETKLYLQKASCIVLILVSMHSRLTTKENISK